MYNATEKFFNAATHAAQDYRESNSALQITVVLPDRVPPCLCSGL